MTRFTILVFLTICTALSHQHSPPCKKHPHSYQGNMERYHDILFNDLAKKVMELDNKLKSSCERHSNAATKEIIGNSRYAIQTPLPEFSDNDVVINVRQKVLYIKAKKGDKHYTEMRILPNFVDVAKGAYTLEDGVLEIAFPFVAGPNTCASSFTDSVTTIKRFDPFGNHGAGPRSGRGYDQYDDHA